MWSYTQARDGTDVPKNSFLQFGGIRHCEEATDEAIQNFRAETVLDCFASSLGGTPLAMTEKSVFMSLRIKKPLS